MKLSCQPLDNPWMKELIPRNIFTFGADIPIILRLQALSWLVYVSFSISSVFSRSSFLNRVACAMVNARAMSLSSGVSTRFGDHVTSGLAD